MTRTDIAIEEMCVAIRMARHTARKEAGTMGLTQVLLTLEAMTGCLRDEVRQANATRLAEYPMCEE
jgi:azurin